MGWGSREGCNNNNDNTDCQRSGAARLWVSICVSSCSGEKENHNHKVLWELVKTRGRKSQCTLNRVAVNVKLFVVNFLLKNHQLLIFSVFHGVGGHGGGGRGAITTIIITTATARALVPLASWFLFVPRLAQGCRKGVITLRCLCRTSRP
jgi:hypothetical protein